MRERRWFGRVWVEHSSAGAAAPEHSICSVPAAKPPTTKQTAHRTAATSSCKTERRDAGATAAPAAKQVLTRRTSGSNPKPDLPAQQTANALPTTHVVAGANVAGACSIPIPSSPKPNTSKYPVSSNGCKNARAARQAIFRRVSLARRAELRPYLRAVREARRGQSFRELQGRGAASERRQRPIIRWGCGCRWRRKRGRATAMSTNNS